MRQLATTILALALAAPVLASAQTPPARRELERRAAERRAEEAIELQHAVLAAQGTRLEGALRIAERSRLRAESGLDRTRAALEMQMEGLAFHAGGLSSSPSRDDTLDRLAGDGPRPSWAPQDPADSLYRRGRELLNRSDYEAARRLFGRIRAEDRYARSAYRPDAYYWEAFAMSRLGSRNDLSAARDILVDMKQRYPQQARASDADALLATVEGRLAQRGDRAAAEEVARRAAGAEGAGSSRGVGSSSSRASTVARAGSAQCPTATDEDDVRLAAMNALLNMDAANAMPILKDVLARRDECSVPLRRKAIFLVSQKRSPEAEDVLLSAARSDPDPEVREQAVFWLSNVNTDKAVSAIDEILRTSNDPKIQEKAIFALSQHRSDRAAEILRNFAQRADAPKELRGNALFWLGQSRGAQNGAFLRQIYPTLQDNDLKERVLQAVSQRKDPENADWLLGIAMRDNESMEVRKQALFWAGQGREIDIAKLTQLYDRLPAGEMKKQLLFVLSQRKEPAAVDKLMDIASKDGDLEARKQAIFWLGQSGDPRAPQFLRDLIKR